MPHSMRRWPIAESSEITGCQSSMHQWTAHSRLRVAAPRPTAAGRRRPASTSRRPTWTRRRCAGEMPDAYVRRLARSQGDGRGARPRPDAWCWAPTPRSWWTARSSASRPTPPRPRAMLARLAGTAHEVLTGRGPGPRRGLDGRRAPPPASGSRPMTSDDIARLRRLGRVADKAGAYAIQGRISRFVARHGGLVHRTWSGCPVSLVCGPADALS